MIKVAHVINSLPVGGAEAMLLKLLTHSDRGAFAHRVYTLLSPAGTLAGAVANLVPVRELGMGRDIPNPMRVFQLARWLRDDPPDLVQTWLYRSDLVGGLATRLSRIPAPVVWNIRNGTLDDSSKRRTRWVVKVCARASTWLPHAIICCSPAAFRIHAALGYDASKFDVIPNGFDLAAFRPDPIARLAVRQELCIPPETLIIGLVARFDPQKDHRNFIAAAGQLHASMPHVHFVLCGPGVTLQNSQLVEWITAADITSVSHLLGERHDMPNLTAALDLASSSSFYGEAFPNAIGEAMACEIPCVVTDVGDSAYIVGDTGQVVPCRDAEALAKAWERLLNLGHDERRALGRLARLRVAQNFSIGAVVRSYEETYGRAVALRRGVESVAESRRAEDARRVRVG